MFRVVTFARECGSGGAEIAQSIAERLGWRLLDRDLIVQVARRAQVDIDTARRYDEALDSWWHRMNRGGLLCAAIEAGATPVDAQFFDAETMAAMVRGVIADAASKGNCVIVGRGAQCLLQDSPEALHVFVYAPWAVRVDRVRKRLGGRGNVAELLRSADETRTAYIRRHFGRDWKDPHLYDMMVNSQLGVEIIASAIAHAVTRDERTV
jgi:cytidylate kinase